MFFEYQTDDNFNKAGIALSQITKYTAERHSSPFAVVLYTTLCERICLNPRDSARFLNFVKTGENGTIE